jgi:hypothetical protein
MNAHHDKLSAAASAVTEWNTKIRKLREDISTAEAALADSTRLRQQHVLDAALGDDAAKSSLAAVLQADRDAERHLDDLKKIALPAALERLRAAENDHRVAESEFRKAEVNRLARLRCLAAAEIDQAFAMFSKAYANYESLGHELLDLASQEPNANALYLSETVSGVARLSAALPMKPFYDLRHRHSFAPIGTSSSLAAAESAYWRLPPAEEVRAA